MNMSMTVEMVREASRKLVREWGFMDSGLAATPLAPSALHTLLEIDIKGPQTAAELSQTLNLEKSSISRMLKKLIDAEEIYEMPLVADARQKQLHLTKKGTVTVATAHQYAKQQTESALLKLPLPLRKEVVRGLTAYADALEAERKQQCVAASHTVSIEAGYKTGAIGRIAYLFSTYFSTHYDFDQFFEGKVATELSEFSKRLDNPHNNLWLAIQNDDILGSVAIDGEDLQQEGVAHLRWFIVDARLEGQGVGRKLLEQAILFCKQRRYKEIHLWTVKGLVASSHLYDRYDFVLTKEFSDNQWGRETIEQQRIKVLRH